MTSSMKASSLPIMSTVLASYSKFMSGRRCHHVDDLGDECRLLGALDLDHEADDRLGADRDLVGLLERGDATYARVDRNGSREAQLVGAVVHAERQALHLVDLLAEHRQQREGEVAVGDGSAERALLG